MPRSSTPSPVTGDRGHRGPTGESADVNAVDVSRYVADICGELSKMSKSAKLIMLSYLLAMARQEAERVARKASAAK